MLKGSLSLLLSILSLILVAQTEIAIHFIDGNTSEDLIGVNVFIPELKISSSSNMEGLVKMDILSGEYQMECSYLGYATQFVNLKIPSIRDYEVSMIPIASELDEIVVVSSRANRSVASIPSRIEVITDEIEEAATMDPSKIAHLLMHTTGVQVQQQSATSGAASVRIQGLYGRYTQILKDGFPIYGGIVGGLGVLQIPPLDLKQVEFVKGSSSTLYGGGAIGGLINLISKTPSEEPEASVHLNLSHIGNLDVNGFYSHRENKWGMTLFTSNNSNPAYDVDSDGFSDVPEVRKFNFNPRIFYYPSDRMTLSFGGALSSENRIGGEMRIIDGAIVSSDEAFFERNKSQQVSTLFQVDYRLDGSKHIELKNSTNSYNRNIFLNDYNFSGKQFSSFSELSFQKHQAQGDMTLGINFYTDKFSEDGVANASLRNQSLVTLGVFGQYIHDFGSKFSTEIGIRTDYNMDYGSFFLPKFALVYKPTLNFSARVGGGLGYKLPSMFTEDSESLAFQRVLGIDENIQDAEKSIGFNGDISIRLFSSDKLSVNLTEYFFFNRVNSPLVLVQNMDEYWVYSNSSGNFETKGIESLLKASAGSFHLYLGYTYVHANQSEDGVTELLPLTPEHSVHGDLMFIEDGRWRCGIDAEFESEQILRSGRRVQSLFKAGFLAERMFENVSFYINLENWTDTRQTKYESLVIPPQTNPRFTEVWAPLDGFIFNSGVKLKL